MNIDQSDESSKPGIGEAQILPESDRTVSLTSHRTLLGVIDRAQSTLLRGRPPFAELLRVSLDAFESSYGYIAAPAGNTLKVMAAVLRDGDPIREDDRAMESVPAQYPGPWERALRGEMTTSFQPLPMVTIPLRQGDRIIGIIAVGGRKRGYRENRLAFFEPFLRTCRNVLQAWDAEERRRTADRAARAHAEWLDHVFGIIGGCAWESNFETGYSYVSPGWTEALGYSPANAPRTLKEWMDITHPEDLAHAISLAKEHHEQNTPYYEVKYRLRNAKGEYVWIMARSRVIEMGKDGNPIRIMGSNIIINPMVEAEERLRLSEQKYRQIVETASEGVWVADLSMHTTFVNRRLAEMLGVPPEEMIGKPVLDFVHPSMREESTRRINHQASGGTDRYDVELLHADGSSVWTICSAVGVRDSHGQIVGVMCMVTDIRERKQAERDLKEARATAEAATEEKSNFLASISHELRTPLTGILGMTSLMQNGAASPEQRAYLQTIRQSGELLLNLINDLLDSSKVEAGGLDLQPVEFDPRRVVEEVCGLLGTAAEDKGLDFIEWCDVGVPRLLEGDAGRLRQILVNLVGNAIKFTVSGSVALEITASGQDNAQVTLCFAVRDTGVGIHPDQLSTLYRRFGRLGVGARTSGTGLGLSICRDLARVMGGNLEVDSTPGKGSTFAVTIPFLALVPGAGAGATHAGAVIAVDSQRPAVANGLLKKLQGEGHDAITFDDGESSPNVVIIDACVGVGTLKERIAELRAISPEARLIVAAPPRLRQSLTVEQREWDAVIGLPWRELELKLVLSDGAPQAVTPLPSQSQVKTSSRLRVLLAEDNATNREVVSAMMARHGVHLTCVGDGELAVEATRHADFDMILMDCMMPRMDGFEATRRIVADNPAHRPVIVALTASGRPGDRDAALAAGMQDFISKPFDVARMDKLLRRHFPSLFPLESEGHQSEGNSESSSRDYCDLAGLARILGGDMSAVRPVMEVYVRESEMQIGAARAALAAAEWTKLARHAHRMQGAARGALVTAMVAPAQRLEAAAIQQDGEAATFALQDGEATFTIIREILRRRLGVE